MFSGYNYNATYPHFELHKKNSSRVVLTALKKNIKANRLFVQPSHYYFIFYKTQCLKNYCLFNENFLTQRLKFQCIIFNGARIPEFRKATALVSLTASNKMYQVVLALRVILFVSVHMKILQFLKNLLGSSVTRTWRQGNSRFSQKVKGNSVKDNEASDKTGIDNFKLRTLIPDRRIVLTQPVCGKEAIKGIHKVRAVSPIVFTPKWKIMFSVIIFVSHKFSSRETIAKQGSCAVCTVGGRTKCRGLYFDTHQTTRHHSIYFA